MITSAQGIIDAARKLSAGGRRRRVAVAAAQDAAVLEAVMSARDDGICDASLFGDKSAITKLADENGLDLGGMDVVDRPDAKDAVAEAVGLASSGEADVIMKGFVSTSGLLKGVLDRRFNLRKSPTLSHVAVLDIPGYHKLLMTTDGGMIVKPSKEQRLDILKNAVLVGKALGIDPVKVAVSAATDSPTPSMPQSRESAEIAEMVKKQNIAGCLAAGPMSFDTAVSAEIAGREGITTPVAGDADVYLVGSIEECNITTKSMIIFAEAVFAGVIVGAKVPVSLVSRTDPVYGKKTSIALACLVSDYYRRTDKEATS